MNKINKHLTSLNIYIMKPEIKTDKTFKMYI